MAKKKKQVCSSRGGSTSSDDSDMEKSNRKDERGRTVLAKVGEAIQNEVKLPLDWHPVRKTPCGKYGSTFMRYLGVVVRERLAITYCSWKDIPISELNSLYDQITKGFTVPAHRRKWILSRADDRWRAFKTRLRKLWLYKKSGKLRKRPPWKYRIQQSAWDKFKEMCTTEKFQEVSEDSRKRSNLKVSSYRGGCLGYQYFEDEIVNENLKNGKQVDLVPRHELWIRAHSRAKDGEFSSDNPVDKETAEEINVLKTKLERGELVLEGGRDDILARALKKPEHGGRVRGVGSGITITEYFGFSKPTPPSQMRVELTSLKSEMAFLKNNVQLMMSFLMKCQDPEQIKQFMVSFSQLGNFGSQGAGQFTNFDGHISGKDGGQLGNSAIQGDGMFDTRSTQRGNLGGHNNDQLCDMSGQNNGFFTQLLTKGLEYPSNMSKSQRKDQEKEQQLDPYIVPWPDKNVETIQQPDGHDQQASPSPSTIRLNDIDYDTLPITEYVLPKGTYDCCLAIENEQGIPIVAIGKVYISGETEVTLNHFRTLSQDYRRVSITEEIMPTAPLPCPNEECSVVCQAVYAFVSWPAHLIFPKKKFDKQQADVVVSQSRSSQSSTTKKYDITEEDRAKVNSGILKALKKEALGMKKSRRNILISIPENVFHHQEDVRLDYEDLFDLCFQKEIGAAHMSIFMKYLSESCHTDGISGMYGFCDSNHLSPLTPTVEEDRSDYLCRVFGCNGGKNINQLFFAPFHENRHWMLAAISPWNGTVFWLDPAGSNNISEFAQRIINEGIIKFTTLHRKDIKKIKKNPVRWMNIQCPRQSQASKDCGYFVCRYIIETIASRRPMIPDQYFPGTCGTYTQEKIDEIRNMWVTYLFSQMEDEEIEDDDNMDA
ncbi:uncharacterized protein LOC141657187 [Silene latifolia]|uniref:uncharacterized protein LOC141657187 n=1 Tax=Silene latifolia TaxID=37657 RepID=UPI003D7752DD